MENTQKAILYMVIPCYNEEEVLHETSKRLADKYKQLIEQEKISSDSRVVFVDDGSKDKTWEIIQALNSEHPETFSGIKLAHNAGHQNAVLAGLMTVKNNCDISITMDADLQDDINAIDSMIDEYYKGSEIVYGVRSKRETDTFFKRFTAEGFYKFMAFMGVDIIYNHADFRLMSRKALEAFSEFKEVNLFLRGIVPLIGFKTAKVYYERAERFAGESKYPLKKMLALALNGITSFSVKPLKMITSVGFIVTLISFVMILWSLIVKILDLDIQGWTSLMCSIWLLGGLNMISLGVVGEYIGKIYSEVKARPRFIIEKFLNKETTDEKDS